MTSIPALIRAAQQAVAGHTVTDWSDPDSLSDEQLAALAGPGCAEFEAWEESRTLPVSIAGLTLLAGIIEQRADAELRRIVRAAPKETR